jgi:hypothetical protein
MNQVIVVVRDSRIHGQLGIVTELCLAVRERRVLLTGGSKVWFKTKELKVVNESG